MSKGRSGTTGSGYLSGGAKKANQELMALKNEVEELRLKEEQSKNNLLHFINELDEANRRNKELEEQLNNLTSISSQEESAAEAKVAVPSESAHDSDLSHDACKADLSAA